MSRKTCGKNAEKNKRIMKKMKVKNKITFKKKPPTLTERLASGQTEGFTLTDLQNMWRLGLNDGIGLSSPGDVCYHKDVKELREWRFVK